MFKKTTQAKYPFSLFVKQASIGQLAKTNAYTITDDDLVRCLMAWVAMFLQAIFFIVHFFTPFAFFGQSQVKKSICYKKDKD